MPSLRAVLAGLLAFPAVVALAALTAPFALLVVGVVPGAVAGTLADPGGRSGLVHGLLVGACCTVLFWALLYGWLQFAPPERIAPGFGLSIVLLAVFGLLVGVESVVSGALVGFVRR